MADTSFIANGVQTPGLQPIAGMLNMANTAQQLQRGNVELQKERIVLGERKNIQQLFSNPETFKSDTGDVDYNKLINEGMKVAPTTFPAMIPAIITAHTQGIQAKEALNRVNQQTRDQAGQYIMSLAGQPPEVVAKLITAQANARPELAPALKYFAQYHLQPASENPDAFKAAILKVGQATMAPTSQGQAITPSGYVATNNVQTGLMNTNPLAGNAGIVPGTLVNQQLPLGERQTVSTNPVTQTPVVTAKDAFGNVQGVTQAPTGPGVPALTVGQPQDIPIVTQERSAINERAADVPNQHLFNREIIKLAPQAVTGTMSDALVRAGAAVGFQWTNDWAADSQRLGHFMAMQIQDNLRAMATGASNAGRLTDMTRGVISEATTTRSWTPRAIIKVAKVTDAMATALENFNIGMERAIGSAGNNVLEARTFKNKWTQAFDPDVYRYGNALQQNDQAEINDILGPKGTPQRAARAKALAEKSARLNQLVTTGQ